MNRILLDTSAFIAFLRGHASLKEAIQRSAEVSLSVITLGELRAGFLKSARPRHNEGILARFLASPRVRVIGIDEETSHRYAAIFDQLRRSGAPVPVNDLWIAASAFQHGLRLLTLDHHFRCIPQVLVDFFPSEGKPAESPPRQGRAYRARQGRG